jgi:hypothetical protein
MVAAFAAFSGPAMADDWGNNHWNYNHNSCDWDYDDCYYNNNYPWWYWLYPSWYGYNTWGW